MIELSMLIDLANIIPAFYVLGWCIFKICVSSLIIIVIFLYCCHSSTKKWETGADTEDPTCSFVLKTMSV